MISVQQNELPEQFQMDAENQKKTVYYNNKGQMQYGQQRIGNGWYLFSWGTGAMQTGLQNLKNYGENKTVYYERNGQGCSMVKETSGDTGICSKTERAKWQPVSEFKELRPGQNRLLCRQRPDAIRSAAPVWTLRYLFDKNTGTMAKGLKWIGDQKRSSITTATARCNTDSKTSAVTDTISIR